MWQLITFWLVQIEMDHFSTMRVLGSVLTEGPFWEHSSVECLLEWSRLARGLPALQDRQGVNIP
jgi:hypothetical protein